ncbi:MAG: hypothetical protein IT325_09895 [Anaerolineae bacterium]|nr:hypothetical protein [Anaerolineae bacterium]
MPLDPSIPLQAKAPDPLQTMGQWIGLARQKQALERETATLPTDIEKSKAESERARIDAEKARRTLDDYIRQQRATAESAEAAAKVASGSAEADIVKRKAESGKAVTEAEKAKFGLSTDYMSVLRASRDRFLADERFDPDSPKFDRRAMLEAMADARDESIRAGAPRHLAEEQFAISMAQAAQDPRTYRQTMQNSIVAGNNSAGQAQLAQPVGIQTNSGQVTQVVNANRFAGPVGQAIQGTRTQQQPPPTTQVFYDDGEGGGRMGLYGAQGGGVRPAAPQPMPGAPRIAPAGAGAPAAPAQTPPPRSFVPSGPPMGAEANMQGQVQVVQADRTATASAAAFAEQNKATLAKIREIVTKAPTGVGADKQAFAAGLGALIGMESGDEKKSAADLLNKYSAQLQALTGGNTDMARSIVEAAIPNSKMTDTAIRKVARELTAVQDMALAKQRFLARVEHNPVQYREQLAIFNRVADPRVFQFPTMNLKEQAALRKSMTPAERGEFEAKLEAAEQFGLIR